MKFLVVTPPSIYHIVKRKPPLFIIFFNMFIKIMNTNLYFILKSHKMFTIPFLFFRRTVSLHKI